MEQFNSNWIAVILAVYLVGWYAFFQIIKNMAPTKLMDKNQLNEEADEKNVQYIYVYYVMVGIAAFWFLWIIFGLVYGVYYIFKKLASIVLDETNLEGQHSH